MTHLKVRLFALLLILVCSGLAYYNWYEFQTEGTYSFKIATFAPVCVVGGIFLFLFPTKVGKPDTTREKLLVFVVLGLGLAAGLVNWYLMDPGTFGGG